MENEHEQTEVDRANGAARFLLDRHFSEHRVDGSPLADDESQASASSIVVDYAWNWLLDGIVDARFSEDGLLASEN